MKKKDNQITTGTGITKNVFFLGLASLFNDISSQMIFPLLPLFLANVLGVNKQVIGLIEGIAESTASLLKVFSGWLSDKIKQRKSMVFCGYLISTLGKLIFPFSHLWPQVLFARFSERVGKGIRTSPRDAIIADSVEQNNRGKAFGFQRMMDRVGGITGTALAFFLLNLFHKDFRKVFLIAVLPGTLAVLTVLFFVTEKKKTDNKNKKANLSFNFKTVGKEFKIFIAIATLFSLGNFSYFFLILRSQDLGIPPLIIPLVYLIFNIVYALFSVPVGILSDRWGRRRVLSLGYTIFGVVCIGFILANKTIYAWILFAIYGIFQAIFDAVSRALASDLATLETRATSLGMYHTCIGLAAFPASLIAGRLWHLWGAKATFSYGATLAIISAILMLILLKNKKD